MNNKFKFIVSACLVLSSATYSFGQANSTANAISSATIITPLLITKTADMNFGTVAVSTTVAGTVTLAPAGTRTPNGGVSLPAVTGSPLAASFSVTGLGTSTYAITLPTTLNLTDGASHTMTVDGFLSTPSGTGALVGGAQTITVGATLHVSAAQAAATYSNATGFPVTVCYN